MLQSGQGRVGECHASGSIVPARPSQAVTADLTRPGMYNTTMQDLVRNLLVELGEDPEREGLVRTPARVERALRFLTSGYKADIDEVVNNALFTVDYN